MSASFVIVVAVVMVLTFATVFIVSGNNISISRKITQGLMLSISLFISGYFLSITPKYLPHTYDITIIKIDDALGNPAVEVARLFLSSGVLAHLCGGAYCLLLVGVAYSAAWELRSGRINGLGVIPTFFVAAILGFALYCYVPAVGPEPYFGRDFPFSMHAAEIAGRHADFVHTPRNCFPSLHVTFAALAFLAMRGQPVSVRITSGIFFLLTALATLGFGFHYAVDLIAAAPFVLFIRAICAIQLPWPSRVGPAIVGAALEFTWCVIARGGLPQLVPSALIPLVVGTLLASVGMEAHLALLERRRKNEVGKTRIHAPAADERVLT